MAPRGQAQTQQGELKSMKNSMIRYILNMSSKKTPIKSADIVRKCLQGEQKMFVRLLPEVQDILSDVYGYQLNEIKEKTGKCYLVTTELTGQSAANLTVNQREELRLLFIVLSYIFMKGGKVMEAVLFGFLKKLDIEEEPHEYFGNFRTLITEPFVKQMYLKKEKIEMENTNMDDKFEYSWGPRADLEFNKKDCLEWVAKIMKKPASSFVKQWNECQSEDEDVEMEE
ncbi:non-structural maintenance of chromosomes element 3 homolog [Contarinia nasturtii]|uniref:non-structural maintenance of chromosomes element 3 homolog n=1 Tax=Contarinia nasturtii TaxID=265458 RepID=UPI0012D4306D|nr:non-structural maintenance of chromosomes element 3 homolog [Contarinia nasturtii]